MNITEYKLSTFVDKMNRNGFYFSTLNIQFAEPYVWRMETYFKSFMRNSSLASES